MTNTMKAAILVGMAMLGLSTGARAAVMGTMPVIAEEGRLELLAADGSLEAATDGTLKMMTRQGMEVPAAFLLAFNERARVLRVTNVDASDECGVVVYLAAGQDGSTLTVTDQSGNRCHKAERVWEATFVSPTEGRALWAVHAN